MPDIVEIKSQVMKFVERNGPVLPVQIAREISNDSIFAGAVLSELVSNKRILVSHAKVGGSPVYYVSSQKPKVEMLYKHLHERERKIFDILKKEKVVKDTELEPWQRVAVREIKDFSVKLTIASTGEVFWKWYALLNSQAEEMIRNFTGKTKIKKLEPVLKKLESSKVEVKLPLVKQKTLGEVKGINPKEISSKKKVEEEFKLVQEFLNGKGADIVEEKVVRKKKDVEYVVQMPFGFGKAHFFVKFKDKKKINDADLSLAQGKAKSKHCSLIVVSTGELTKKAVLYAEKHNIIFQKLNW